MELACILSLPLNSTTKSGEEALATMGILRSSAGGAKKEQRPLPLRGSAEEPGRRSEHRGAESSQKPLALPPKGDLLLLRGTTEIPPFPTSLLSYVPGPRL